MTRLLLIYTTCLLLLAACLLITKVAKPLADHARLTKAIAAELH